MWPPFNQREPSRGSVGSCRTSHNSTHTMPAYSFIGSVLLCTSLAPSLVAGVVVRTKASQCPLANCPNNEEGTSLLELSSKKASSKMKCGNTFTPAHFTCSSCDVSTCKGCKNVVCDVSKCIGKFFTQECWCTKPLGAGAVDKIFCDSDCTGGLCNTQGLTCKTRESQCKPWWWCNLPPPKEADSFLQTSACAKKESSSSLMERFEKAKAHALSTSAVEAPAAMKKQISAFSFQPGSFVCESAMLPQPDEDPVTLAQTPPGFIVLDGNTCQGGYFLKQCFCYDKFKYLRGEDPITSELMCDDGCGLGDCQGKTCGKEPPPPLPPPSTPPPLDPLVQEMAMEASLRNYGTQMSPVT